MNEQPTSWIGFMPTILEEVTSPRELRSLFLMQINEDLPCDVVYSLQSGYSKMYDNGSETVARKRVASDGFVCVPACRAEAESPRRPALTFR